MPSTKPKKTYSAGVDFGRLTLQEVEALVGRKADDMQVMNKHIVCTFRGGSATENGVTTLGTDIRVHFRKW